MKESILDINLVQRPSTSYDNGKDQTNGGRLDNGAKCFMIVDPRLLLVAFGNQSSFLTFNGTIGL